MAGVKDKVERRVSETQTRTEERRAGQKEARIKGGRKEKGLLYCLLSQNRLVPLGRRGQRAG